jgi:hypothetical protein
LWPGQHHVDTRPAFDRDRQMLRDDLMLRHW